MSDDKLNKIIKLLQENVKWVKFNGIDKVRTIVDLELDSDIKKIIYHLSDGGSSPQIAKKVKIDSSTVRDYWKKWSKKGLMEIHPEYKKRYRKIFTLEEIGIEPPDIEK